MTARLPWLHAFLDMPAELVEPAARFWAAATGAELGTPWPDHPEFRSLEPATGSRYLHVQCHGGPPRLHPDLTTPRVDADAARLVALGATAGTRERWWQVLRSPGGLPFCLVEETPGRARPEPVRWRGGHRSRVAELVLDVPADGYPAECRFWRAATGWADGADPRPGSCRLLPPDTCPLRLLLHRRRDDTPAPVRAEPSIDTDDLDAELRRLVALGAHLVAEPAGAGQPGAPSAALRDPAGLPFRVARR